MAPWVLAGTVDELRDKGRCMVVGGGRTIAVFCLDDAFFAVDNRCPHMGFPLDQGTVHDGILTCHWHHARFDVSSGGTLDPFADDVPAFDVEVRGDEVWVCGAPRAGDPRERTLRRLREGLRENIGLVLAKAAVGLHAADLPVREALAAAADFGCRQRAGGWSSGLTILTALANLREALEPDDRPLALYHGLAHVARDCAGQPPLVPQRGLEGSRASMAELGRWLRRSVEVRDEQGAMRIVRTALESGGGVRELAEMTFAAATDHVYLAGGHALDFLNKAFELLELVGWAQAAHVLPAALVPICRATRAEEAASWRHPIDLIAIVSEAERALRAGAGLQKALAASPQGPADEIVPQLLGEDPATSVKSIVDGLLQGRAPADIAQSLAYAAACRMARFPTSNEFSDWISVLHTFTYCNALHQALLRAPTAELVRGLLHGAMAVYLDRFLNVPLAREPRADAPPAPFREALLAQLDAQQQVEQAAALVLGQFGLDDAPVIPALGRAVVREDAEFHTYQALEAGWRQYQGRRRTDAGRTILLASARYIAAHAPTPRAMLRTAEIAQRLRRGDALHAGD